ncbi:hypothetical protein KGY73_01140 [bacterium]|nr:hypothetical protein [bacterium]
MIFILTGPVHSGKTTFLCHQTHIWKKKKLQVDGFLSVRRGKGQTHLGYDLYDLKKEKSLPFIRKNGEPEWPRVGPYYFIPQSLKEAQNIIFRGEESFLVVIDELGPLELKGQGLWPSLEQALFQRRNRFLLVVRESILDGIIHKLDNINTEVSEVFVPSPSTQITEKVWRL